MLEGALKVITVTFVSFGFQAFQVQYNSDLLKKPLSDDPALKMFENSDVQSLTTLDSYPISVPNPCLGTHTQSSNIGRGVVLSSKHLPESVRSDRTQAFRSPLARLN